MLSGRGVFLTFLFLAALFTSGGTTSAGETAGTPAAPDAAELRRILTETFAQHRIQTEFPSHSLRGDSDYHRPPGQAPGGEFLALNSQYMFWAAATVFVIILLLTLYDNLYAPRRHHSGAGKKNRAGEETERVRERMEATEAESDALATAGDYAGAMHLLLLCSLEEMRRRLGVPMAASLTSREILARTRLEPEAHLALGAIVGGVEVSWFGTHLPDAAEFSRCRQNFQTLRRLLGGGSAK